MNKSNMLGFASLLSLSSCTTMFIEYEGECVVQQWSLASIVLRRRQICDLPSPELDETQVRDREAMDPNPFPGLLEQNDADSIDPDLLEKHTGHKPDTDEGE